MPTIAELTDLFGDLPELPPPVPRKRVSFAQQKLAAASQPPPLRSPTHPEPESSPVRRAIAWLWSPFGAEKKAGRPPRPTNPFPSLKTGSKMVVIAAVDAGTISFFRFGPGVFTEWPMV